jgi:hypothetical protein
MALILVIIQIYMAFSPHQYLSSLNYAILVKLGETPKLASFFGIRVTRRTLNEQSEKENQNKTKRDNTGWNGRKANKE